MAITVEHLYSVNRCQIAEMEKAGKDLDPEKYGSCQAFSVHVRNVQAAVIHTYSLTAYSSVRESDPAKAAELWKTVKMLCEDALRILVKLKEIYPHCGTTELYDLVLDYRSISESRYYQNLQDSECAKMTVPAGLFPTTS